MSKASKKSFIAVVALLLFITALCIYWPRAAVSVQESDGGEMATAAVTGDLVHPPGYPLYMLIVRQVVKLCPENPYLALARFSSVAQALAVPLLFLVAFMLASNFILAASLAASWMLFEPVVRTAVDADVFALQQCLALCVVLMTLPMYRGHVSKRWCLATGVACGLGGAHHHTIIFWAPFVIGGVLSSSIPRGARSVANFFMLLCIGAALGMLPYLTLFMARGELGYAALVDFKGFLRHLLRADYGTFSMHAGSESALVSYLWHFLATTFKALPFTLVSFPLLALVGITKRSALSISLFVTGLLHLWFASKLVMGPELVLYGEFAMRHYAIISLSLVIMLAALLGNFALRDLTSVLAAAAIIGPALLRAPIALSGGDAARDRVTDAELDSIMEEIPPNGIFVATLDRTAMGLLYRQKIFKQREDVVVLVAPLVNNPSYTAAIKQRGGVWAEIADTVKSKSDLMRLAKKHDRVVTAYAEADAPKGFSGWPIGVIWEWRAEGDDLSQEEVGERLLKFCARWPDKLSDINPDRAHSKHIYSVLFLDPLSEYRQNGGDPAIASLLERARELFSAGKLVEGRRVCLSALES